ncbi:ferritin-like domain-containing protein [Favolaschia claudopus]|uniref:Ferritin-like domain-containing protein n=1 Tax=Favolaschia claudopus TaxID=2862362 RepID=A0AAW0B0G8_9AGAR
MRYSTIFAAVLASAPLLTSARPVRARDAATNALVFQFANVLNQLESEFYKQGIAKFKDSDFTAAGFTSSAMVSQALTTIKADEDTHIAAIQAALTAWGNQPLTCNFKFDSALTDVPTMAATARTLEFVGVSAFLGAANLLPKDLLDAAGMILTVEARHSTLLNIFSGKGSAIPSAFDIGLTPQEILGVASGFIDGACDLGLTATKPLTITNKAVNPGDLLTVQGDGISGTDGLFCNMIQGGNATSVNLPLASCNVPQGTNGPIAVWITKDNKPLSNDVTTRATDAQVAGPAIIFVDSQPEQLGQMVRKA